MKNVKLILFFSLFSLTTQAAELFSPEWISEQAVNVILRDVGVNSHTLPQVRLETPLVMGDGTEMVQVRLADGRVPEFSLYLRGPAGFMQSTQSSLRALLVIGGFFTGADSSALLGRIPGTVTIGFNYPYSVQQMKQDPAKLLQTFRLTAPQIALGMKWISGQGWLKKDSYVVMGVSLGGLFLPTALRLAQSLGVQITHTVFAFTGANLSQIFENNLQAHVPSELLNPLKLVVTTSNTLNNPQWHLPFLKGRFLMIHSDQDQVIPRSASEELFALLPEKKARLMLHGEHIDVNQPELIAQTRRAVLSWLSQTK